jgi:hypothetical protein
MFCPFNVVLRVISLCSMIRDGSVKEMFGRKKIVSGSSVEFFNRKVIK